MSQLAESPTGDVYKKVIKITVPLPYPRLTQNLRMHHMQRARHVKEQRAQAGWWAESQVRHHRQEDAPLFPEGRLRLDVVMRLMPGFRALDDDNAWASLKPVIDGLADALRMDDKRFIVGALTYGPERIGTIEFTLTAVQP